MRPTLLLTLALFGCDPGRDTLETGIDPDTGDGTEAAFEGTVSGLVLLPGGEGAVGADVSIAGLSVLSDSDGAFVFDAVPPGTQTIVAELGGYESAEADVDVVAGDNASVTLTLTALLDPTPLITAVSGVPMPVPRGGTAALLATSTTDTELTWSWVVDGDFSVVGDGSGEATLTAPDIPSATATVTVIATNGTGQSDDATLAVQTVDNEVPQVSDVTATPAPVSPGGTVSLVASASDPDDSVLVYDWTAPPDWTLNHDGGPTATLTAPDAFATTATVTVTVTDPWGAEGSGSVGVSTVANTAPTIDTIAADPTTVPRGGASTLTATASDAEGQDLTWSWTAPEGWTLADATAASTTVTAPESPSASAELTVVVTDSEGATDSASVTVTTAANIAPIIEGTSAEPNPAEPTAAIALAVTASDPDGDDLQATWNIDDAAWTITPDGLGAIATAPDARGATATATVRITDAYGAFDEATVGLATSANLDPVIESVSAVPDPVVVGDSVQLDAVATDPNGDTLTFTWLAPDGWTSDQTGASVTYTAPDSVGNHVFTAQVTDPYGGITTRTLTVSVVAANSPPTVELPDVVPFGFGRSESITASIDDPDGDELDITWTIIGDGWTVDGDGAIGTVTPPLPDDGARSATLRVTVSDGTETVNVSTVVVVEADGVDCQDVADAGGVSGVYWLQADDLLYPAACDMDHDGNAWTLLYKRSSGVQTEDLPADFFEGDLNAYDLDLLDRDRETLDFASAALPDHWGDFSEARVEVVDDGQVVQWMHYDTFGSTPEDFLSPDRLVASSWESMVAEYSGDATYWGIQGQPSNLRYWYINRTWGGCPNDQGWLIVNGSGGGTCGFDQPNTIIYSPGTGARNVSREFAQADALLVWVRDAAPGVSRRDAVATCADLPDEAPAQTTWWIDPDGPGEPDVDDTSPPFLAYCDDGWTMAFKKTSGVASDPNDTWMGGHYNTEDPDALTRDAYVGDYANYAATTGFFAFSEARVEVLVGGEPVRTLRFDLEGRTHSDWFAQSALVESSWTDLPTASTNFFSITGDASNQRHFFLNQSYGGCGSDTGWLVAKGNANPCSWETRYVIHYASADTAQNWTSGTTARADALAVFLR